MRLLVVLQHVDGSIGFPTETVLGILLAILMSLSGQRAETSALTLMGLLLRVCWVCWVDYRESVEVSVGDYAESLSGILLRLPAPYLLDLSPGFCKDCSWDC